jgi:hypothetical protein
VVQQEQKRQQQHMERSTQRCLGSSNARTAVSVSVLCDKPRSSQQANAAAVALKVCRAASCRASRRAARG